MASRKYVSNDAFVEAWNTLPTVAEVARKLGMRPHSVSVRAVRLRHRKVKLPYKAAPGRERLTAERVRELNEKLAD